jgi:hypothetical protein
MCIAVQSEGGDQLICPCYILKIIILPGRLHRTFRVNSWQFETPSLQLSNIFNRSDIYGMADELSSDHAGNILRVSGLSLNLKIMPLLIIRAGYRLS